MDNLRPILVMVLVALSFWLYQSWQNDYGKPKPVTTFSTTSAPTTGSKNPDHAELPTTPASNNSTELPTAINESSAARPLKTAGRITVKTDVLRIELDLQGGDVRDVKLLNYKVSPDKPDQFVHLMDDQMPNLFVMQSGLLGKNAPNHQSIFHTDQTNYTLADGSDTLEIPLLWQIEGVKVTKIYRFKRGSYLVDVDFKVENQSGQTWSGRLYSQLQRSKLSANEDSKMLQTYLGAALGNPQTSYQKVTFEDIQKIGADGYLNSDGKLFSKLESVSSWNKGWIAMLQHYFVTALVPTPDQSFNYYTKSLDGQRLVIGLNGADTSVENGQQQQLNFKFYAGPKIQGDLANIAHGLDLTVDYGWFWFIAQPLFWLLKFIYAVLGNWGWSIIVLTILVKAAFYHLSATSYKSMADMKRLQPRLQALKERYGDDKTALNQAMMDLYKKEKINPLGGCLPILIQLPVFIALYWVLIESVEMRHAPFMLWLNNLSVADPYFILPLLMGATMLIQHKLNPSTGDPIQEKVMLMLPIMFTFFFAFFPAGLVLYWTVSNILSIAQQWHITKKMGVI
jgi:YidC/Oxa1 family membrane protein insertase